MELNSKEHYDLISEFEKSIKSLPQIPNGRFDKEDKDSWAKGYIYQDGELNAIFLAYRMGYALGICAARN